MPSTIDKCELFRIEHSTLLEGKRFLSNKYKITFFLIKCTFCGRKENRKTKDETISLCAMLYVSLPATGDPFEMLTVAFGESSMSRKQKLMSLWSPKHVNIRQKLEKQWRKWFWIIVELLLPMMLTYRSPHAKQFLRMFQAWKIRQQGLFQNC